jgi:hypothetical protein
MGGMVAVALSAGAQAARKATSKTRVGKTRVFMIFPGKVIAENPYERIKKPETDFCV